MKNNSPLLLGALVAQVAIGCATTHAAYADTRALALPKEAMDVLKAQHVPGAAWFVINGDQTYAGSFGVMGPDGQTPTLDTFFHLASISKPMTAIAIMQLVEAGKLNLDAKLVSILPAVNSPDGGRLQSVTVRDLVTHRTGLKHMGNRFDDPDMSPSAIQNASRVPLEFAANPGGDFDYNNRNYDLLGAIVEKTTGMPYEIYVRDHVFKPVGANTALFGCINAPPARVARGYTINSNGSVVPSQLAPNNRAIYASGGACMTPRELANWGLNVLSCSSEKNAVLRCDSVAAMTMPKDGFGLGWFVDDVGGVKVMGHSGTELGYATELLVVPEKKLAVAVATNFTFTSTGDISHALLATQLGSQFFRPRVAPSLAELRSWTGRYYNEKLGWSRIELRGSEIWFVYEAPGFDHELTETKLFPKPDWNPTGYYYAGTFRGGPMVLDGVVTSDNPNPEVRTAVGSFTRVDNGVNLFGQAPATKRP